MKKILYLFSSLLIMQFSLAQDNNINYEELLNTTIMPTDEEIAKIVNQFNFPQEEKNRIIIETKKQLQEIYDSKDAKLLEQKAVEGVKILNQAHLLPQDFTD